MKVTFTSALCVAGDRVGRSDKLASAADVVGRGAGRASPSVRYTRRTGPAGGTQHAGPRRYGRTHLPSRQASRHCPRSTTGKFITISHFYDANIK